MKKIILIILLTAGWLTQLNAQVPGYMGKRFALQFNLGITPAGIISKKLFDDGLTKTIGTVPYFHLEAGCSGDYAVSRRKTIGWDYGYLNNALLINDYYMGKEYYKLRLQTHTVLFKLMFHKKTDDLAAPVGFQQGMGFGVSFTGVGDVYGRLPRETGAPHKGKYTTVILPQFMYMLEYKRVFNDRLIFSTGLNVGLFSLMGALGDDSWQSYDPADIKKSVKNVVWHRVARQQFANFRVGVGYLF